jgi:DNA-binding GntR family transcriptional regulator
MLQVEGLIVATPNRGATVRVHTPDDLEDLYALRALLEGHAARRAGGRVTEAHIELLRESCDRFETLSPDDDLRELVRENLFFHSTILDIAGSARLAGMVRGVIELPLVYKSYIWYSPDQKRISSHYHRQIVRALATGDAERAELVMKEHVFEARDILVGRLRDEEREAPAEAHP